MSELPQQSWGFTYLNYQHMKETIYFVTALLLAIGFILLLRPLAHRIELVDNPGGRKDHSHPTPVIGGIAIFCTFALTVLMLDMPLGQWRFFILAGAIVFIIGLLDDIRETPPATRFVAQIGASLIIVMWGCVELQNLGALFSSSTVKLGLLAAPFTIFCSIGVINAVNMQDGLDGLSGGMLLILFAILLFLAWRAGLDQEINILLLLCGALVAFLLFNFRFLENRPATIFMGDAGSLFLGLAASWFLIRLTQEPISLFRPVTAVWLFALPIMDTVAIIGRRVMLGRSPFTPDREHFHHIILLAGFSVRSTVLIILGCSMLFSGIGLVSEHYGISEFIMFFSFVSLFAAYYWGMRHAWKVMKALRHVHDAGSS